MTHEEKSDFSENIWAMHGINHVYIQYVYIISCV